MPEPTTRLRGRSLFVSGAGQDSIVRASTLVRPTFADSEKQANRAGVLGALFRPGLHEAYAAPADHAALVGFGLGVLRSLRSGPLLWVRHTFLESETGGLYPPGLRAFGFDPASLILVRAGNPRDLLQAGLEAARCKALAGALLELNGTAPIYDLAASRRLMLAARTNELRLLFLRSAVTPVPSAAETRWQVRPLASRALPANAPGFPVLEARLLRSKSGAEPSNFVLEWNPDAGKFEERGHGASAGSAEAHTDKDIGAAPLSGSVVSLPVHRQAAPGRQRRTG
ncbi:MAG: hypothetical protein KF874_08530 [Rhizobiaceae bacterium]|nr:hypothetical protein [Rhizobiaceae bacterium]